MTVTIDRAVLNELTELIEDSVQYHCDHYLMSGETAWNIIECFAQAKQAELQGQFD